MTSCPYKPELIPKDVPMGLFHCPDCGNMVIAGWAHPTDDQVKDMGGRIYE